ncbi:MAG: hypothetical protein WDN29_08100 [Methylovirgula sp.]
MIGPSGIYCETLIARTKAFGKRQHLSHNRLNPVGVWMMPIIKFATCIAAHTLQEKWIEWNVILGCERWIYRVEGASIFATLVG